MHALQAEGGDPGSGHFDRQRQAVELAAELDACRDGGAGDLELAVDRARTLLEECQGAVAERIVRRRARQGDVQRPQAIDRFVDRMERFPRRGEPANARGTPQERAEKSDDVVEKVLAVVQGDQGVQRRQAAGEVLERWAASSAKMPSALATA